MNTQIDWNSARWRRPSRLLALLAVLLFSTLPIHAQEKKIGIGSTLGQKPGLGGLGGLGSFGGFGKAAEPFRFAASYEIEEGGQRGKLILRTTLEPGYSIYSVTQPKGGPLATTLALEGDIARLEGPFTPDQPPQVKTDEVGFEGVRVEKHFDQVSWSAPISLSAPFTSDNPPLLVVTVDGQVCKEACIPIDHQKVEASFQGFYRGTDAAQGQAPFREAEGRTAWTIELAAASVAPGEKVDLILSSTTSDNYHIYEVRAEDPETNYSTVVVLTQKSSLLAGPPVPSASPIREEMIPGELTVAYHEPEVAWKIPIRVPLDRVPGLYPIEGYVKYQACNQDNCDQPLALRFRGELKVDATAGPGSPVKLAIESVAPEVVDELAKKTKWIDPSEGDITDGSVQLANVLSLPRLLTLFASAMLGGFVLNFMPCVLPVIGLKIMSFVKEGKQSGSSVTLLNLWYIAGILTVFVSLAFLTIGFRSVTGHGFGWGEQFGHFGLRLGLTILMFAMALSFLGVWEIPIPGFATSQQTSELMQKEGPFGAYFKGLLTTILATPCAGPGLGAVFAVSIDQPAWVITGMYLGVGLGMSLPYLVIAMWPEAIGFLPKPGPWMQTLKEILAFPMLLSVVWFLTTFSNDHRIAVVTALIFVWLACWWIGKVPVWAEFNTKVVAWTGAVLLATFAGWGSLHYLGPHKNIIDWVPYSSSDLARFQAEGKTVMIDFTAQWCANCKVNLFTVIETPEVAKYLAENEVVPMLADFTDRPAHIKEKIHELQSNSIPLLAIYPAGKQDQPIVLRDQLTKNGLLTALREAGPSQTISQRERKGVNRPVSTPRGVPQ